MQHFLRERPPWAVVGVSLGLIVVAVQATINQQAGVLGGFSAVVERASGRTSEPRWKAWFLVATATFFGTAIVGSVVLSWLGVD